MNHSASDRLPDSKAVHSGIARTLAMHADLRYTKPSQIPAYTRRHLPEHAVAGECVNEDIVNSSILPYLDVAALRQASSSAELPLMRLVSKVAHAWDWEHPGRNAAALRFIAAAEHYPVGDSALLTPWRVPWAKSPSPSEILARIDSFVSMGAARLDGRTVVITAARRGRVKLWDLASGRSEQLRLEVDDVSAVAIEPASGGGAIVGIGTEGGLVRCCLLPGIDPRRAAWPDDPDWRSFDVGDAVTALCVTTILQRSHILAGQANGGITLLDYAADGPLSSRLVHGGQVTGIASVRLDNGAPVAVSVGVDGWVRLLRLSSWLTPADPVGRSDEAIRAVVALRLARGKAVAVTAGDKGTVRIWDLPPESPNARWVPGHDKDEDVIAVAAGTGPHGEPLVVTGGSHGRLRIVDPDEARVIDGPIAGHGDRVAGLAIEPTIDGRSIAVSGGADGIVRRWDLTGMRRGAPQGAAVPRMLQPEEPSIRLWRLDDGRELGGKAGAHSHRMTAVAVGYLTDGTPIAVTDAGSLPQAAISRGATIGITTTALPGGMAISASGDGRLRFWDLAPLPGLPPRLMSPTPSHPGIRAVVTASRADGVPVVVSAGRDCALKIWDMRDGQRLTSDLVGHQRPVTALAVAAAPGPRTFAVSGSEDASLRVWDLDAGEQIGRTFREYTQRITALAAAWVGDSLIAVTACRGEHREECVVRWCDPLAVPPRSGELIGHDGPVTAVAVLADPERPLVVTASEDHTIRVWDLMASAPLQVQELELDPMPVPGVVRAIACFNAGGPRAVIVGDDVLAVVRWGGEAASAPAAPMTPRVVAEPQDKDGPRVILDRPAGVQVGSGNYQVNNYYVNQAWPGTSDAPVTSVSGKVGSLHRGHAFISYVRENSREVDELQRTLEAAGVPVWRDTDSLGPGDDWRRKIRDAITHDALVFIACFSSHGTARRESYQNEELVLAVEQLRLRRPDDPWLIPVRFDDCDIPDLDLGAGRTLSSLQRADLFGPGRDGATERLVAAVQRLLGR